MAATWTVYTIAARKKEVYEKAFYLAENGKIYDGMPCDWPFIYATDSVWIDVESDVLLYLSTMGWNITASGSGYIFSRI